jgi:hypothetical protein
VYITGASAIGVPGCPEFAACTASIHRVRIVSMASFSMGSLSRAGNVGAGGLSHGQPSSVRDPDPDRGQSVVVGRQSCLNARYRPRLAAKRMAAPSARLRASHAVPGVHAVQHEDGRYSSFTCRAAEHRSCEDESVDKRILFPRSWRLEEIPLKPILTSSFAC